MPARSNRPPFDGQIALPLPRKGESGRIVVGNANSAVFEACRSAADWPFLTAILSGPPRSGRSLVARWFEQTGLGTAIDDAMRVDEDAIFHRWNRAQETRRPLLIVGAPVPAAWPIRLPDLASRLGAALNLSIQPPDDEMIAGLIELHAEARGLALADGATTYLVPRAPRGFAEVEALVERIDRLSLERKVPATQAIWREAIGEDGHGGAAGGKQGQLL